MRRVSTPTLSRLLVISGGHQSPTNFQLLNNAQQLLVRRHQSATATAAAAAKEINASPIQPAAGAASEELANEAERCYKRLDLSFSNSKEVYKSKTNSDLLRALLVFRLCTVNFLVQNNQRLLQFLRKTTGATIFKKIMKSTFYGHFVAGENLAEVTVTVAKLSNFGVKSILDYSVEADLTQEEAEEKAVEGIVGDETIPKAITEPSLIDPKTVDLTHQRYSVHREFGDRRLDVVSARTYFYEGEKQCDINAETFCKAADTTAAATEGRGFITVKLTALGRPQLLLKLSETIAQTQNFFKALTGSSWENLVLNRLSEEDFMGRLKDFGVRSDSAIVKEWFKNVDFDHDGFVDFYDWGRLLNAEDVVDLSEVFQVLNIKTGRLEPLIKNLSKDEVKECANMMARLVRVAEHSMSKGIRMMIDAEQSYFQPAISRLTVELMRKYNKNGGMILNTYQAYLKSALNNIRLDLHLARRENFHFGCKLVRGAYMDQERKRAEAIGYEDPINPTFDDTSRMYHSCLDEILREHQERGPGSVSVMVASHNEDSIRYAVQLMKKYNIAPSERVVCFGQLYGMCDHASFSLGHAGYSVYKYLPYGPVEDVLPYLSRRALENGGMLNNVSKESKLLWGELKRRLGSGQLMHAVKPQPV